MSALTKMRIDDFATMKYGKMPPKNMVSDDGYPIFSGYRVTGYAKEFLYKEPELIVVARGVGGTGDVKISPPEAWITNLSIVLNLKPELVDKKFLYYRLGREPLKERLNTGAAQAQITIENLRSYEIEIPDLKSQKRIASVLSAYDDLIENNRRRIRLLEEAARLLYREWFVHFRFPGCEHFQIVDGVPDGWKRVGLFEEANALYGFAFKSKKFNEDSEGKPVVRIRDILEGVSKTYTTEEAPKDKMLEDGDLLVGMDGIFHQNYWVGGRAWINQRVVRISSKGVLSNGYLRQAIRKPIENFNETIAGTTVAHLGAKHLKMIDVLVPPKHLLEDANDFFENTRSQFVTLSKQNQELVKARDLLLPRLMDGRLEI